VDGTIGVGKRTRGRILYQFTLTKQESYLLFSGQGGMVITFFTPILTLTLCSSIWDQILTRETRSSSTRVSCCWSRVSAPNDLGTRTIRGFSPSGDEHLP
jgi:hypothetical protein